MVTRRHVLEAVQSQLLDRICTLSDLEPGSLHLHPEYEGCQNSVFYASSKDIDYVVRITYRQANLEDAYLYPVRTSRAEYR